MAPSEHGPKVQAGRGCPLGSLSKSNPGLGWVCNDWEGRVEGCSETRIPVHGAGIADAKGASLSGLSCSG